jgi:hypothetical protein
MLYQVIAIVSIEWKMIANDEFGCVQKEAVVMHCNVLRHSQPAMLVRTAGLQMETGIQDLHNRISSADNYDCLDGRGNEKIND